MESAFANLAHKQKVADVQCVKCMYEMINKILVIY